MGLHPLWIVVAAQIGWDTFVLLWETFSANHELLDGRNRITLPSIDTYRRFQRIQAIRTMFRDGMTPEQVSEELMRIHKTAPKLERLQRMLRNMRT